jgi:hypothetical protein
VRACVHACVCIKLFCPFLFRAAVVDVLFPLCVAVRQSETFLLSGTMRLRDNFALRFGPLRTSL